MAGYAGIIQRLHISYVVLKIYILYSHDFDFVSKKYKFALFIRILCRSHTTKIVGPNEKKNT